MRINRPRSLLIAAPALALLGGTVAPADAAVPAPYSYSAADFPHDTRFVVEAEVDPGLDRVYLRDQSGGEVQAVDRTTGALLWEVEVPPAANSMAVDTSTHTLYVSAGGDDDLTKIDGATGATGTLPGAGASPLDIAADPTTHRLYVTNGDNTVSVVDPAAGGRVASVSTEGSPSAVAVDPVARRAYVPGVGSGADTVSVIDLDTNTVVSTVGVGSGPYSVAVDPVLHRAYVGNMIDGTVSVIEGATATVVATVGAGPQPSGIAVDPVRHTVYVAAQFGQSVTVIDGRDDSVSASVPLGYKPGSVAVDSERHAAYVVGRVFDNKVSLVTETFHSARATVTAVSPASGPTTGGQQVTVSGDHFTGATKVVFGKVRATRFTVDSDGQITATVPAQAAGAVQVRVQTAGLSAKSRSSRYTYLAPSSPNA